MHTSYSIGGAVLRLQYYHSAKGGGHNFMCQLYIIVFFILHAILIKDIYSLKPSVGHEHCS